MSVFLNIKMPDGCYDCIFWDCEDGFCFFGTAPDYCPLHEYPNKDEWCTDCHEYDAEHHCCPRFNRVIRNAIDEYRETMEDDLK